MLTEDTAIQLIDIDADGELLPDPAVRVLGATSLQVSSSKPLDTSHFSEIAVEVWDWNGTLV